MANSHKDGGKIGGRSSHSGALEARGFAARVAAEEPMSAVSPGNSTGIARGSAA
jgi:hypothetical protein